MKRIIFLPGNFGKVAGVNIRVMPEMIIDHMKGIQTIEPIDLTFTKLVQFGFLKVDNGKRVKFWRQFKTCIVSINYSLTYGFTSNDGYEVNIKYVHNLQNFVETVSGDELVPLGQPLAL